MVNTTMSKKKVRLTHELNQMAKSPSAGILLWTKDDNLNIFGASITGPENTAYEHGLFKLELQIPDNYPFAPPSIIFLTPVYHPNVDNFGRICLNLLKMPPIGDWRPTLTLETLLIAIRMLLGSPNPDDPLMLDIAHEFTHNKEQFIKSAKLHTEKYAVPKAD